MDQDTSNNPGKASWREKLGLGTSAKDMPKISNEFKSARANLNAEPKLEKAEKVRPARPERVERERGRPQPVARPAPMAPRPQPANKPQGGPLAERLKAQRQAAEKLAEQRILAARSAAAEPKAPEKPKFTFAEEEIAQARREAPVEHRREPPIEHRREPPVEHRREAPIEQKREYQPVFAAKPAANGGPKASQASSTANLPPLVPPRPALGGERPIAPPAAPEAKSAPAYPPRFQGAGQASAYRPIDPPQYQSRQQPALPPQPQRPAKPTYGNGAFPAEPRAAQPRAYDAYRRRGAQDAAATDEPHHGARGRRSPPLPARGRQTAYEDELGDVFEDEAPPRRRPSAQDYHQAYRDYEEGYGHEDRRRSSGPWLIALILFIVAVLATAAWYYFYFMKPGQMTSAEVPVVAAPDKPAKTGPEPMQPSGSTLGTSGTQGALETTPERRKQIYDRVLGEETIDGNQIVPTQEPPKRVEPTGDQAPQLLPGAQPQPGAQGNSGIGAGEAVEPLPLPLPPPPGSSDQGNLDATPSDPAVAAAAPDAVAQPASASGVIAPIPGEAEEAAKLMAKADAPPPIQPPATEAAAKPIEPPPAKAVEPPPKPKAQAAKARTKKKAADVEKVSEPEPLDLIPEGGSQAAGEPAAAPDQIVASDAQPQNRSGSFFNFGSGSGQKKLTGKRAEQPDFSNANLLNTRRTTSGTSDQVASISPDDQAQPLPIPAPETSVPKAQSTGGGYYAQLASFRSEAEALAEYDRLRSRHGGVVGGLPPRITKANVSGASRYRLGVGPVVSREAASRICNSLIAAGERDCLVRGN